MIIRHKHTGQRIGGTYEYWKTKILPFHQEINYDILTHPDIVDVYEINPENGKLKFIEHTDRSISKSKYLINPKYTIKDCDLSIFDELYRLKHHSKKSFLSLLIDNIKKIPDNVPNRKQIIKRIKASTISKFISGIIISVIGGLLILIIWDIYKDQLKNLWEIIF